VAGFFIVLKFNIGDKQMIIEELWSYMLVGFVMFLLFYVASEQVML
jgi:hypothetical protein